MDARVIPQEKKFRIRVPTRKRSLTRIQTRRHIHILYLSS